MALHLLGFTRERMDDQRRQAASLPLGVGGLDAGAAEDQLPAIAESEGRNVVGVRGERAAAVAAVADQGHVAGHGGRYLRDQAATLAAWAVANLAARAWRSAGLPVASASAVGAATCGVERATRIAADRTACQSCGSRVGAAAEAEAGASPPDCHARMCLQVRSAGEVPRWNRQLGQVQ